MKYVSFTGREQRLILKDKKPNKSYMISANAYVSKNDNSHYTLKGYVPLNLKWHLEKDCKLILTPEPKNYDLNGSTVTVKYDKEEEAEVYVKCKS